MLSNSEILKAKKILNEIIILTNRLNDFRMIKNSIEDDDNFSIFIHNTFIGADLYSELLELIGLIKTDVCNELNTLNNYTYNYLNSRYDFSDERNNKS